VKPAEPLGRLVDHGVDTLSVGHVEPPGRGDPAGLYDLRRHPLGRRRVDVGDSHMRSRAGKRYRGDSSQSAACARDQRAVAVDAEQRLDRNFFEARHGRLPEDPSGGPSPAYPRGRA